MFIKTNTDKTSKAMQNAGIKEALKSLKEIECFYASNIKPIINSISNIISAYTCVSCTCLKRRIKKMNTLYSEAELKYNTKSLIF